MKYETHGEIEGKILLKTMEHIEQNYKLNSMGHYPIGDTLIVPKMFKCMGTVVDTLSEIHEGVELTRFIDPFIKNEIWTYSKEMVEKEIIKDECPEYFL